MQELLELEKLSTKHRKKNGLFKAQLSDTPNKLDKLKNTLSI